MRQTYDGSNNSMVHEMGFMDKTESFEKNSMSSVTIIIVQYLLYNQRMIKVVVERCLEEIHPITSYIDIMHLTEKSVTWVPQVDIGSFQSVKNKR